MTKSLKKRIETVIEAHGVRHVRTAARSVMSGDRDALRALDLDDCYRLELKQILEMAGGRSRYDPDAALREMLG